MTRASTAKPMSGPIHSVQRGLDHFSRGNLWVGAGTPGANSDEVIPLTVLAAHLSERLFELLRAQESLVYGVSVSPRFFEDAGAPWVQTNSRRDLVDRIAMRVEQALEDAAAGRIDAEGLERAKVSLAGNRALRLETSVSLGFELLSRLSPERDKPPADFAARMKQVDAAALQATAARIFEPANRLTAVHRPFTEVDTLVAAIAVLVLAGATWLVVARRKSATRRTGKRAGVAQTPTHHAPFS